MNRITQALVWIRRIRHCRGFGIQSPTDYRFVRYVINEHWPYYEYDNLTKGDGWLKKKLGKLYMRLSNHLQPTTIIDLVGAEKYLKAGCRRATCLSPLSSHAGADLQSHALTETIDLALVPIQTEFQHLFSLCDEHSVVVFENIYQQPSLWHCIEYDRRVAVTFDLYYCGIVIFNKRRTPANYIVNF